MLFVFASLYGKTNDVFGQIESKYISIDTIPINKNKSPFYKEVTNKGLNNNNINFKLTDSLLKTNTDTLISDKDSIKFNTSKDTLSAPVEYYANDSIVLDVKDKKIMMYGKKSNLKYGDNELSAPYILYDQQRNIIHAHLEKDSNGKVIAFPTFNQSDFKSISDSISFNMKNGKGITKGTYTQQGEMFVYGQKIKKTTAQVFYANKGRFTTCNLDTPHFAFVSNKIKFINKKMAFTGPVHPEIEAVPLPIILPFGIYPLKTGIHSGFISPNFTANDQLGLALEGLGYYKAINENWDIVTRGTIYSYGGWTMNVSPRYNKRYHYQGNFSFDMQHFKKGFKGDPDFSSSKTYNIRWSHSADTKARPGVNFNANVNAGSSKFNAQVPNSPDRNFTNQLNSSITYSKVWKDKPYNISVSANHNQNTQQRLININLPDIAFNVNTQYPFRRKEITGNYKWYENIGVALNTNAKSLSSFYDTASNIMKQFSDNLKWGTTHSIPITLSLPPLGPLQVSPSVSYQERWYQEQYKREWNPAEKKLDTIVKNGIFTARDMSFGIGMSTRIFGMFSFKKTSKVLAVRHEIRPTVSANYKPNMNAAAYYRTQIDTIGNNNKFSYYERSIFGAFSDSKFGGLNFGLDNIVQMKVRNKKDTSNASVRKISLLDGLSLNGNYNFLTDSFRMSNLSLNARSNLFDKINITANAVFDPYLRNDAGRRIDKLIWTKKPASLGMLTSGGVSLQSRFTGGNKNEKKSGESKDNSKYNKQGDMSMDEYQSESDYIQKNSGEFVDFSIPWDLDLSYSLRFSKSVNSLNPLIYKTTIYQDVNWSGHIKLTPKWNVGVSGSYNMTLKELGVLSLNLSRDLHCWQMNVVMSPVGRYRYFTINISPKSSLLRDIKVNRTRYFYDL